MSETELYTDEKKKVYNAYIIFSYNIIQFHNFGAIATDFFRFPKFQKYFGLSIIEFSAWHEIPTLAS